MEREKIVEALRGLNDMRKLKEAERLGVTINPTAALIAADMLENDQREAEALRAEIEKLREINKQTTENKILMFEMVKRLTAERDAAVECLRGDCMFCKHLRLTWNGNTPDYECPLSETCLNRDNWEWSGPQKEA